MMRLKYWIVKAFVEDAPFSGNAAAVVLSESPLEPPLMQRVAALFNLSETAFCIPEPNGYSIRWFTPRCEIELAGHPTLAAAAALGVTERAVFRSPLHRLVVSASEYGYELGFPRVGVSATQGPIPILSRRHVRVLESWIGRDLILVLESEQAVRTFEPDEVAISKASQVAVAITAPGDHCDYVCRFFAPNLGVTEDDATGSLQCQLAPLWAERLGRERLTVRQLSPRGGAFDCHVTPDGVALRGRAIVYASGRLDIPGDG